MNYIYQIYAGKIENRAELKTHIINGISNCKTAKDFERWLFFHNTGLINPVYRAFIEDNNKYYEKDSIGDLGLKKATEEEMKNPNLEFSGIKVSDSYTADYDLKPQDLMSIAKVYGQSDLLKVIGNVLCNREGTDFAAYSAQVYLTYLDWYGITNGRLSQESDFNPTYFHSNRRSI